MLLKIFRTLFFALPGLIILIACEEEIPLELNDQEFARLVVEGRITNQEKVHRIRLTRTLSYFDNQPAPVPENAEVYIIEEETGRRIDFTLSDDTLGFFESPSTRGNTGRNYTLHVIDGEETYQATSYLDTVPDMDSINYIYEYFSYFERGFYIIRMSAYEPPPMGDYYMFYIYVNDTLFNKELANTPYETDLLLNDAYISNVELIYLPQEHIISDTNIVRVEMLSISESEYNYNNTFLNETYGNGSIFSGPPANIPSNMKSTSGHIDGLGFFGASAYTSLEMPLYKEHNDNTNSPDYERN